MSKIAAFFQKKKAEFQFKSAGAGRKLGDASSTSSSTPSSTSSHKQPIPTSSKTQQAVSAEQKAAAAAALARYDQSKNKTEDFEKRRTQALIRAQAKKELEKEKEVENECQKLRETYGEKEEVEVEVPTSVAGVFYTCPLIGNEPLPKDEMKKAIRNFLYEQLDEEKGLTACLIIHTCNSNPDKIRICVETLIKYLNNILENPTERKYRQIRKSNKAYQDRVAGLEGHDHFLTAVGFESQTIDGEEFWVYDRDDIDVETISLLRDSLISAEPLKAELDRGTKVILPEQKTSQINVPDDFYVLTPEEIKKEQMAKKELAEREGILRTKAMKEREEIKEKRKYRFTLLRIRFPDGFLLQGTFSVYEPFTAIEDFVRECLELPMDFCLVHSAYGGHVTPPSDQMIIDVGGLVPSAILNFQFSDPDIVGNPNVPYLKDELKKKALK